MAFDIDKWITKSKAVWGAILAMLVAILPNFGISFTADDSALLSQTADVVLQAALMLFTVYGRYSASTNVTFLPGK